MKVFSIETGNLKLDGGAMFGVVPKAIWQKLYPADENNMINLSMRCLLVITEDRKILIDTGIGDKQDQKFFGYYYLNGEETLLKSLEKLHFNPEDITDVVLTHLHIDHCGGSVKYNENRVPVLTFPNANYWISQKQWELAQNPNRQEKPSLLKENIFPIAESGQMKIVEKDGELFPGFTVKFVNGHTVGQLIPHIRIGDRTVVFCGDLIPTMAHVPVNYLMAYDTNPLICLDEKESFIKKALEEDYILFFEHDLYRECCNLQLTPKGIRPKDSFKLADLIY